MVLCRFHKGEKTLCYQISGDDLILLLIASRTKLEWSPICYCHVERNNNRCFNCDLHDCLIRCAKMADLAHFHIPVLTKG